MNNTEQQNTTETNRTPSQWTNEKAVWWTVCGVRGGAALVMHRGCNWVHRGAGDTRAARPDAAGLTDACLHPQRQLPFGR